MISKIFHSELNLSETGQQGLALWPDDRSQSGDEITAGPDTSGLVSPPLIMTSLTVKENQSNRDHSDTLRESTIPSLGVWPRKKLPVK
jgi:hypothetical protein